MLNLYGDVKFNDFIIGTQVGKIMIFICTTFSLSKYFTTRQFSSQYFEVISLQINIMLRNFFYFVSHSPLTLSISFLISIFPLSLNISNNNIDSLKKLCINDVTQNMIILMIKRGHKLNNGRLLNIQIIINPMKSTRAPSGLVCATKLNHRPTQRNIIKNQQNI